MNNILLTRIKYGVLLATLVTVAACGGGGGGGGTGGGGGGGGGSTTAGWTGGTAAKPEAGIYVEFLRGGQRTDPLNLQSTDSIQLVFANYDALGTRTVLSGGTFSLTGGGGNVTLTTGGLLTVNNPGSEWAVTGHRTVGSTPETFTQDARVATGNAVISGTVLSSDGTTPIPYLQFETYDSSGNVVGAGLTDGSGTFHAATSTSATLMGFNPNSVTASYFRTVEYKGNIYSANGDVCAIAVPALSSGGSVTLPSDITLIAQADGPPPPPNACGK